MGGLGLENIITATVRVDLVSRDQPGYKAKEQIFLKRAPVKLTVHTSLRRLESFALAGRPLSFAVDHPDGDVVDAVGLQARHTSLAAVPGEHQGLLRLLPLLLRLVQPMLTAVVHL